MQNEDLPDLAEELARRLKIDEGDSHLELVFQNGKLRRAYTKVGPLSPAQLAALVERRKTIR